MSKKLLDQNWNLTVNLGIKCNALGISRQANVRYFSSPFDNIDTVDGLVNCGKLISQKFEGYFSSVDDWKIKNDIHHATNELRAKIKWHKDSPDVFYPHFYEAWIKSDLTPSQLDAWKNSLDLDITPVWNDLKTVFTNRQGRLINILENSENKVLFIRIDERRSLKRLSTHNKPEDFKTFIKDVSTAFPNSDFGILYLYCRNESFPRVFEDSEKFQAIEIPENLSEEEFSADFLRSIKLLPKSQVTLSGKFTQD